ncbi:hypothetical protein ACFLZJ_01370 [Nanoarchaeota archaeon]
MTKQTLGKKLIEDFNPEEYKSFEQKYIEPVVDYLLETGESFVQAAGRVIAYPFKIPTGVRRSMNGQGIMEDEDYWSGKNSRSNYNLRYPARNLGFTIGAIAGLVVDISYGGEYLMNGETYIPLAVWATTNALSGIYELGRKKQSKIERQTYLEAKEEKKEEEAKKVKKNNK